MIKDALIGRLGTEPALSGLDDQEVFELLKVMDEVTLPAQRVLTWEDTPVGEFGIVLSGALGVYWGHKRINEIGAGGRFGVDEYRATKTWTHALVSEGDTRILVGSVSALPVLMATSPNLAAFFGAPVAATPSRSRSGLWGLVRPRAAVAG